MDVGVPALRRVVGGGCLASAFVGAALGAGLEPGPAGLAPLALLDLAGERAAVDAAVPGTFQARWLDVLAEGEAVLEAVK
jgi:hydroxyethylthiazole kinase